MWFSPFMWLSVQGKLIAVRIYLNKAFIAPRFLNEILAVTIFSVVKIFAATYNTATVNTEM
jgi:hypothetical protein